MKKIFLRLLVVAMTVFLFTGCSSKLADKDNSTQTTTKETNTNTVNSTILFEKDADMINNYSLLAVNPNAPFVDVNGTSIPNISINVVGAEAFINWMLSEEGESAVTNYGYEDLGESLFSLKEDAPVSTAVIPKATEETKTIRLSTTTSVNDSGLLENLLPIFEKEYGYEVEVFSAGTGKAIANATYGNADVILVHAMSQEQAFVDTGFSYIVDGFQSARLTFMYNYFVLVGPSKDLAGVASAKTVKEAFALIANGEYPFVSRGDGSGTHTQELSLWPTNLGITADPLSIANYKWYVFSNAGMGTCITMAEETNAYILCDKATYLTFYNSNGK